MAIIKCPECGRQVSDMAPTCPSCGVEIAGKILRCRHCGEIYFKAMDMCPNCHQVNQPVGIPTQQEQPQPSPTPSEEQASTASTPDYTPKEQPKKKKSHSALIMAFIFAVVCCGVLYYFYHQANEKKELEAYTYAMQSTDPMVLQSFLDNYPEAAPEHRDSIAAHLERVKLVDNEWTNALVSGSKSALEEYLKKYPDTPHKQEAWNKIDSLDWMMAKNADTAESYEAYLDNHADGEHFEEAENALKLVKGRDLQPEEKRMVSQLFRSFFQSINSKDESGLVATCEDILSSLLGKQTATQQDVITFMHKLYKEGISNMNWHINDDYQIKKREVGDNSYEYSVQFTAVQDVDHADGSETEAKYRISAIVSPEGKISEFNLTKLNVE